MANWYQKHFIIVLVVFWHQKSDRFRIDAGNSQNAQFPFSLSSWFERRAMARLALAKRMYLLV